MKIINGEWQEITDTTAYYRRVKAVITPQDRGVERELRVRNNNGSFEKYLIHMKNISHSI